MQRSNLMPFFWARLVASALLAGSVFTGCAAGGGSGDDADELSTPSTSTGPQRPVSTPATPAAGTGSGTAAGTGETPLTPVGTEQLPAPSRDTSGVPPEAGGGDGSNPPSAGGTPANDDDDDDDDRDDDRDDDDDDRDDDDDDDDDDRDDDDDDDDDRDDDDDDDDDRDDDDGNANPNPNPNPVTPPPNGAVTFTADIRPILLENCGRCHASGGLPQFASADPARAYDVAFDERNSIVSEIRGGDMPEDTCDGPPGSNGCVSAEDFALIQQWVAAGAPE